MENMLPSIIRILCLFITLWSIIIAVYVPYCPDERELPFGFVKYSVPGGKYISQTQLVDGVKKKFRCFKGYRVRGTLVSECINGVWSAPSPYCIPDPCEPIDEDVNNIASVEYDLDQLDDGTYYSGTIAQITCEIGLTIWQGDGTPRCNAGNWMPEIPLCLRLEAADVGDPIGELEFADSCELPLVWEGHYVDNWAGNIVREGSQLYYECESFAEPTTEMPVTCFQGRWHPQNPGCVEKGCQMPSVPSFVRVEEEITDFKLVHGTFLHFHCIPGYEMTAGGLSQTKCWFGEWTNPLPRCVPDDQIDYQSCGRAGNTIVQKSLRGRIVGGYDTNPAAWPWQAGIFWRRADGEYFMFCAGTVITSEWILSAGHCFGYDEDIARLQVRVGVTNQATEKGTEKEQIFHIDGLYMPKGHDFISFDWDIALLHVEGQIAMNPFVRPVCLPKTSQPAEDTDKLIKVNAKGMVIGWGHTTPIALNSSEGAIYSDTLKQLEVPIRPNITCVKALKSVGENPAQFTSTMFCAGYNRKMRDTCFGDSGGPLMRKLWVESLNETRWVQVGIVSAGQGCAVPGLYGFYSHIPKMMHWVDMVMQGNHTASEHDMYVV